MPQMTACVAGLHSPCPCRRTPTVALLTFNGERPIIGDGVHVLVADSPGNAAAYVQDDYSEPRHVRCVHERICASRVPHVDNRRD